jgi:hypothetical protein
MIRVIAATLLISTSAYGQSIAPYYGTTDNAAAAGLKWNMNTVLPTPPGLDINTVLYRYTPLKETDADMKVHVQNENANGNGYIFRETDDWSGKPGGIELRKVVGVGSIHRSLWGDGSIEVEGDGSVTDASVIYSYRVDPCYDPQFDPNCPGYQRPEPPEITPIDLSTIYDATKDPNLNRDSFEDELWEDEEEEGKSEEELAEEEAEDKEDSQLRKEKAMLAANNTAMFAESLATTQMFETLTLATDINQYYKTTIPGGAYTDSVRLNDKQLPENRRGLLNGLAQQLLHEKMVDAQYQSNKK